MIDKQCLTITVVSYCDRTKIENWSKREMKGKKWNKEKVGGMPIKMTQAKSYKK